MKAKNIFYLTLLSFTIMGLLLNSCNRANKTGSLTWILKDGTLTISGQGVMPNYETAPWDTDKSFITNVVIDYGVKNIGNKAFSGLKSLMMVEIPLTVLSIGDYAFEGCIGLASIKIPNTVLTIGSHAFEGCKGLISIEIPPLLNVIEESTFANCESLIFIEIPDGVKSIEKNAFSNCTRLQSVTLGQDLSFIAIGAFRMCRRISEINSRNTTPPKIEISEDDIISPQENEIIIRGELSPDVNAFEYVSKDIPVFIPEEAIFAYKTALIWKKFTNFKTTEPVTIFILD